MCCKVKYSIGKTHRPQSPPKMEYFHFSHLGASYCLLFYCFFLVLCTKTHSTSSYRHGAPVQERLGKVWFLSHKDKNADTAVTLDKKLETRGDETM